MPISGITAIDVSRTAGPVRGLAPTRGLPAAFEPHVLVEDDGAPAVAAGLQPFLGECRIRPDGHQDTRWHGSIHGVDFGQVAALYLSGSSGYTLEVPRTTRSQIVVSPTDGEAGVWSDGVVVASSATMAACPRPSRPFRLRRPTGGPMLFLVIQRDGLTRAVESLLGRSVAHPVAFDVPMPLGNSLYGRWHTVLSLLHAEVLDLAPGQRPGTDVAPLEHFLVTTLLVTQTSSYTPEIHRNPALRADRSLRHAVDFIDHHLSRPIRLEDVAAAAGVSARTLQERFKQVFSQSPTQFIRDRRLARARDDLLGSGPADGLTVTAVASRWGFTNAGRFSAAYQQRFGELPSRTLRA